jgi:hypothetical protein
LGGRFLPAKAFGRCRPLPSGSFLALAQLSPKPAITKHRPSEHDRGRDGRVVTAPWGHFAGERLSRARLSGASMSAIERARMAPTVGRRVRPAWVSVSGFIFPGSSQEPSSRAELGATIHDLHGFGRDDQQSHSQPLEMSSAANEKPRPRKTPAAGSSRDLQKSGEESSFELSRLPCDITNQSRLKETEGVT